MIDTTTPAVDDAVVRQRLTGVIDPELGIGIVDLGLVYDVTVDDHTIAVTMTMTTPACPLGPYLEESVEAALADVAGPRLIAVDVVFDPPWSPDMVSPEGSISWGGDHDAARPPWPRPVGLEAAGDLPTGGMGALARGPIAVRPGRRRRRTHVEDEEPRSTEERRQLT